MLSAEAAVLRTFGLWTVHHGSQFIEMKCYFLDIFVLVSHALTSSPWTPWGTNKGWGWRLGRHLLRTQLQIVDTRILAISRQELLVRTLLRYYAVAYDHNLVRVLDCR